MSAISKRIVMLGASGAVGQQVVASLLEHPVLDALTLLNRRLLPGLHAPVVQQQIVDVLDAASYRDVLPGHQVAICTLGVGQPSQMSKAEFVRIDRDAVIAFATACRGAGVAHFELLASVGINANSRSFYLRTKGELCAALEALNFERLSIFEPSMILTPTNRYGLSQALTLAIWPKLNFLLQGALQKYRGVRVETLGAAMAANAFTIGHGVESLRWRDFQTLSLRVV